MKRSNLEHMQHITDDMHKIAEKTKAETVSMRVITLVTLFFLPGTFVSVGLPTLACVAMQKLGLMTAVIQTVMSTPVVHFDPKDTTISLDNIGVAALRLYLAVSLPLIVVTFATWWLLAARVGK